MTRVPLSMEDDPVGRSARQRRVEAGIRAQRVGKAGLVSCPICGGATAAVEDLSLTCVCDVQRAALEARATRMAHGHRDLDGDRSNDIAP